MGTLRIGKLIVAGLILVCLSPLSSSLAVPETKDADITAAIQDRLLADWWIHARMEVETRGGIVKLSGLVDNILADERAVEIAKSTVGVRSVINMIQVDVVDREDEEILRDVVGALERDPAVDHLDVEVKALDGFVTLSGAVGSFAEKHLAGRIAKGVKGINGVENKIQIEQRSGRPDEEVKVDIEGRLKDSVLVDHALIKVQVIDGKVKLTGSVGSASEKLRVMWIAESTSGAKSVDDSELVVKASPLAQMRRAGYEIAQSDTAVRDAIRDALLYDPRVDPSGINVEVVLPKGSVDVSWMATVTLTGTADSLTAKRAAEDDARNTFGVSQVKNQLNVLGGAPANDSELLDNVEKALLADPELGSFSLTVSVLNGSVRLKGTVSSHSARQRAGEIVSRVRGVVAVQNDIEVEEE